MASSHPVSKQKPGSGCGLGNRQASAQVPLALVGQASYDRHLISSPSLRCLLLAVVVVVVVLVETSLWETGSPSVKPPTAFCLGYLMFGLFGLTDRV